MPGAPLARTALARAVLSLYPPAWRERYGDEILALLADTDAGPGALVSLACRAVPVWICPPRQLHDRDARVRASLATVLLAWSALTGVGLVFVQLTQVQGFLAPGHPVVGWSYGIIDAGLACSAILTIGGGFPLWLHMLRQARRQRQRRALAGLALAFAAPAAFAAAAGLAVSVVHHPEGSGPWWFVAFALLGFITVGLAAAGPIAAMRILRPGGPAVRRAMRAAGLAATTVVVAGLASIVAAAGLCLWARGFAGYHHGGLVEGYLAVVSRGRGHGHGERGARHPGYLAIGPACRLSLAGAARLLVKIWPKRVHTPTVDIWRPAGNTYAPRTPTMPPRSPGT